MNTLTTATASMRPASTVTQFCMDHCISKVHLYTLWKEGKGPRRMKVGRRVLISAEAAADWRKAMEDATAAANEPAPQVFFVA